jgi:hypothetical protein
MLALAATNGVGVVLFGVLYAVAGARWLSQSAFLVCLVLLFALVTALWMSVEERQGRGRGAVARLGRVAFGLVVVVIVAPMATLMPLFWLDSRLPVEAGLNAMLAPVMTIVLLALALIGFVNVIGGALAIARTVLGRRAGRASVGRTR